jgi:hypothetical protein
MLKDSPPDDSFASEAFGTEAFGGDTCGRDKVVACGLSVCPDDSEELFSEEEP